MFTGNQKINLEQRTYMEPPDSHILSWRTSFNFGAIFDDLFGSFHRAVLL